MNNHYPGCLCSKFMLLVFSLSCFSLISCSQPSKSEKKLISGNKINGLSFVASPKKINDTTINRVQQVNANWVSLMPFGFMRGIDSSRIQYNSERQWRGERIEGIKETALAFKAKGIQVMLKPQIWVGHRNFTGHIEMKTEEDWKILEQQYDAFILDFARAAEETKCEMFCMGTELNKFVVNRPAYWDSLIIKIRMIYKGKVTYAENWDTYSNVPFWLQLDYIGVDAYFPLSEAATITIQDLEKAWEKHKKEIQALAEKNNKSIIFAEYGYRSCDYAAKEPWTNEKHPINLSNQEIALKALFNSFWDESWFAGGFLWKWYDNENAGGENNSDYTPQNKPAEKIIEQVYGKQQ